MTFGGSPTGVIAPPIFEYITIAVRIGTGFSSITSQSLIVTGVISNTVVTLSRIDEIEAVNEHKVIMRGQSFPPVILKKKKKKKKKKHRRLKSRTKILLPSENLF